MGKRRRITATPDPSAAGPARRPRRRRGRRPSPRSRCGRARAAAAPGSASRSISVSSRVRRRPQARRHGQPAGGDEHDDPQQPLQHERDGPARRLDVRQLGRTGRRPRRRRVVTPKLGRGATSAPPTRSRQASSTGVANVDDAGRGEVGGRPGGRRRRRPASAWPPPCRRPTRRVEVVGRWSPRPAAPPRSAVVGMTARFSKRAKSGGLIERTRSSWPPSASSRPAGSGSGSDAVELAPSMNGTTT